MSGFTRNDEGRGEMSAAPTFKKPCLKAPAGWKCARAAGHYGPCAAAEWPSMAARNLGPLFYVITAKCEGGHTQVIKVDGKLGREWAEAQAGLLDGSSSMYIHPPGPESVIGKCGICQKPITCRVE